MYVSHCSCAAKRSREGDAWRASTWWWSAAGPPARWRRGGWPTPGSRSRWSRTTSSAASARSTPACPRRRCCARRRSCARSAASPAPPRRSPASSTSRPCSTAATRSSTTSTTPRCCRGSRTAGIKLYRGFGVLAGEKRVDVGDDQLEARQAVILSGGTRAAMPPIEGLARGRAVDQPRGDHRQGGPGGGRDPRRRRVRHRAGAGLPLARRRGDADRGRAPAAPHRGGVRLRAGHRGARGAGRRRPHRPQGDQGRARPATRSRVHDGRRLDRRGRAARRRARPQAAHRGARARDRRPRGRRLRRGRREHAGARATTGCTRSATSTAASCSPTWASTRRASPCEHILGNPSAAEHGADGQQSPRVVFTDPQVAAVGHTEKTAREAGLDVHILEVGTSANAGGSFYGRNAPGTSRLLVDKESDLIVGATITGAEVADFLHAATIAIVGEVPMGRLWHATPSFPTRSEIWLNLAAGEGRRSRLAGRRCRRTKRDAEGAARGALLRSPKPPVSGRRAFRPHGLALCVYNLRVGRELRKRPRESVKGRPQRSSRKLRPNQAVRYRCHTDRQHGTRRPNGSPRRRPRPAHRAGRSRAPRRAPPYEQQPAAACASASSGRCSSPARCC